MLTLAEMIEARRPGWMREGACAGSDPEVFFPERETSPQAVEAAKAICAGCAVRDVCLEYALATNQRAGIWGGTSAQQRRRMRRLSAMWAAS